MALRIWARTMAPLIVFGLTVGANAQVVTPIGDVERGANVTITGTVARITDDDEFRLMDATGSIQVYVGPNPVPVSVGEEVTVSGLVDDDLLRDELYASELTMADGTVLTFEHE